MGEAPDRWTELREYVRIVDSQFPLSMAILFGSRARGDWIEESDYDLVLVSPSFSGMSFVDRIAALVDLWEIDRGLEVLPYTPKEFERKKAQICVVSEAVREGIDILQADKRE